MFVIIEIIGGDGAGDRGGIRIQRIGQETWKCSIRGG